MPSNHVIFCSGTFRLKQTGICWARKMRRSIDKYLFVIYFFKVWKAKVKYCDYTKEVLIRLIHDLGKFQNKNEQGKVSLQLC